MRGVKERSELRRLAGSPLGTGILLGTTGLIVWTGLSIWGGLAQADGVFRLHEAWDLPAYLTIGVPIMALAVALAAFLHPERSWRWPLWLVAGHQLGVMISGVGMQSGPSLLILTVIFAILLTAGFSVPALLGAMAARARAERAY